MMKPAGLCLASWLVLTAALSGCAAPVSGEGEAGEASAAITEEQCYSIHRAQQAACTKLTDPWDVEACLDDAETALADCMEQVAAEDDDNLTIPDFNGGGRLPGFHLGDDDFICLTCD